MHGSDQRLIVYCLLPVGTDPAVAKALRKHYVDLDPRVEVVIDRRIGQRRKTLSAPPGLERRESRDRRRFVVPRALTALPPDLAAKVADARWVQRMLPVDDALQRMDNDDVAAAVRAGDPSAPTELYWRWYERLHSRLCVLLGDAEQADATIVTAFGRILDALENPALAEFDSESIIYAQVDACANDVLESRSPGPGIPLGGLGVADLDLDEAVVVREPDEHWSARARSERDRLLRAVGEEVVAIEHVGSTALIDVPARPTIDLLAGVSRMPPAPELLDALADLGYEDCGDAGTPGRIYLRRRGRTRVDLHIVEYAGGLWVDALTLRDFLRRHPGEAQRWGSVKKDAARRSPTSAHRYADLRRLVLEELIERAYREQGPLRESAQRAA